MALLLKLFYRKKRALLLLLCASVFWVVYLLISFSSPKDKTDYVFAVDKENQYSHDSVNEINRQFTKSFPIDNKHNVLQPPLILDQGIVNDKNSQIILVHSPLSASSVKEKRNNLQANVKEEGDTNLNKIIKIGLQIKNKTFEMGNKVKNKTLEVGEKVKNKTLQHLAVLGLMEQKHQTHFLFESSRWNLSISFEDIGNIMKDTEFLNKLQPLDLTGPTLQSTNNRTANYTYKMPFHIGFCDCWERYCVCCAQISNKRLHLNTTVCSNFTFLSKSQEMDLEVHLNKTLIYKKSISAVDPPLICLGSHPKVADICIHFFNMTFKVNVNHEHKTQLLGCTDFSLNLYNRTIGAHPVDCFQIPGDPNHHLKDVGQVHLLPNWMP